MPAMEALLRDPELGWDYSRMVHGDQSFTAHRPIHAGDELVTVLHVDELRTRAGSHFLTLRCEVADTAGEPVLTHDGAARQPGGAVSDVAKGDELPPLAVRVTRADLVRYAGASGDFNPIHWSDRVATSVGLPGVIAHGMLTMALAGRLVTEWIGDPAAVRAFGARFTRPVVVPDDDEGALVELTGTVTDVVEDDDRRPHGPGLDQGELRRHDRARPHDRRGPAAGLSPGPLHFRRTALSVKPIDRKCRSSELESGRLPRLGEQRPHPLDAGAQVVVAQRVGQPEEPGRPERLPGHHGDLRVLQHERGELDGVLWPDASDLASQQLPHRGVGVERPARCRALHAGDRPEQLHDRPPPPVERRPHLRDGVERTGHRGERPRAGPRCRRWRTGATAGWSPP